MVMEHPMVQEDFAQETVLRSSRRPLTPAPSEGPIAHGIQALPTGDPTVSTGQVVQFSVQGRGAPEMMPTPRPTNAALMITPATYTNPNHYLFALNLGGRLENIPLAHLPQGTQLAYELRTDWRRPAAIEQEALSP